jgi:hypothetical protein
MSRLYLSVAAALNQYKREPQWAALQTLFLPAFAEIHHITHIDRAGEYRGLAKHREHHPMFVSVRSPQALRLSSLPPPHLLLLHPF